MGEKMSDDSTRLKEIEQRASAEIERLQKLYDQTLWEGYKAKRNDIKKIMAWE